MRTDLGQAAALHRRAMVMAQAAATALESLRPSPSEQREQHELAERLRAAASQLAPGWLGAPLDAQAMDAPLGGTALPEFVRIGTAQPLDDARFPALVPLLGRGHLTIDADGRDPRVASLLRAVLLRLLAAAPAGSLLVRAVDATSGPVFAPFATLTDAGLLAPAVTDHTGLRAVLAEAEQWVRPARPTVARYHRHDRTLLVVIATLPELTESADLARISALARLGPEAGLHLLIAGWPPPPLTAETTASPLPRSTMISVRNPHALVGDPPGGSFGAPGPPLPSTGLNCPVFLDPEPPARLLNRVCDELANQYASRGGPALHMLLPGTHDECRTEGLTGGLATTIGYDGDRPVTLRFNELTAHWLVGGRPGSGKTAFLTNVLYGLCARHGPDDLSIYLLSFAEGAALGAFAPPGRVPDWLPQLRLIGLDTDREYALAVLTELHEELGRRSAPAGAADQAIRVTSDESGPSAGRVLCVLDEFQVLCGGTDRIATTTLELLGALARGGRNHGIHLLIAGQPNADLFTTPEANALFNQFPVRIALPGGGQVLAPSNDAAAGLPMGVAVVNTAGGLGGPRGATRGHERVIRFPDPYADRATLRALNVRIRAAQHTDRPPPRHFVGYAEHRLEDNPGRFSADPTAEQAETVADQADLLSGLPEALLGRVLDGQLSTATVRLDPAADRHLAVVGPDPLGAAVLVAAARSLARQHLPGSVRFGLLPATDPTGVVTALAEELAQRHPVDHFTDLVEAASVEPTDPGYLLVFGVDELSCGPLTDQFPRLPPEAPAQGWHLLAWWREADGFAEQLSVGDPPIGSLVFVGLPADRISELTGTEVAWRPRLNRALLHDRRTGTTTVIIPFSAPGGDR